MTKPIDMLTWKGTSQGAPLLDEEPQAATDCWKRENQSSPEMSPLIGYQTWKHIHASNTEPTQQIEFIYLCIYINKKEKSPNIWKEVGEGTGEGLKGRKGEREMMQLHFKWILKVTRKTSLKCHKKKKISVRRSMTDRSFWPKGPGGELVCLRRVGKWQPGWIS